MPENLATGQKPVRVVNLTTYTPGLGYARVPVNAAENRGAHVLQGLGYASAFLPAYAWINGVQPLIDLVRPAVQEAVETLKGTNLACGVVTAVVDVQHAHDARALAAANARSGFTAEDARTTLANHGLLPPEPISDRRALFLDASCRLPEPLPRLPYREHLRERKPKAAPAPQIRPSAASGGPVQVVGG